MQHALPDPPSYSAVRAMLRILEDKGHIRHEQDGPRYIYPAAKKFDPDKDLVTQNLGSATYCSPVFANGTLYVMTREKLFAIGQKK